MTVDKNGNKSYGDIDLHGVYDVNGKNAWTQELEDELKCGMTDQGIQHTTHEMWPDRNNLEIAKDNYGPQVGNGKTLTAIFPDATKLQISNLEEMKKLYRAIGVDWKPLYPEF